MKYFSYGSNMSISRITDRVPSANVIDTGRVLKHVLKFHKVSKDGSSKCDIYETGDDSSEVFGVLFEIDEKEKQNLDRKEGLGYGYDQKDVEVIISETEKINAMTYYATKTQADLKPYTWYKEHVVRGAKENKLPDNYIEKLENIEAIVDPDPQRSEKEMKIYR